MNPAPTPPLYFYGYTAIIAAVAHAGLWMWLARCFPRTTQKHKKKILFGMLVMLLLPILRRVVLPPSLDVLSLLSGASMLWHMSVWALVLSTFAARFVTKFLLEKKAPTAECKTPIPSETPLPPNPIPLWEPLDRRQALERVVGLGTLGLSASMLGTSFLASRFDITVEHLVVALPKLPKALEGFTIAQLSDIHVGPYVWGRPLDHALDQTNALRADLIVLTGDILDRSPFYLEEATRAISRLQARYGVVGVLGNHDYFTGANAVVAAMRRAGVRMLVNEAMRIAPQEQGGFTLLGLDELVASRMRLGEGPNIYRALANVPDAQSTVLLMHQPDYWDTAAGKVDLQLSGHTHGGQIRAGNICPTRIVHRYIEGRFERAGSVMWVNRGIGVAGPPVRIGAPAEITRIVLTTA